MNSKPPATLSCGFVLARSTDAGCLTLMLRAYHHWDFPKGLCEQGEEPLAAAMREVGEETGIVALELALGRALDRYRSLQSRQDRALLPREDRRPRTWSWVCRRQPASPSTTNGAG